MAHSFDQLKAALCQDVVIHAPDFNRLFILKMGVSNTVVRTVLAQHDQGIERPVADASHKLLPAETRYETRESECLAIKWTIGYFHYYLMGCESQLVTNHAMPPCDASSMHRPTILLLPIEP